MSDVDPLAIAEVIRTCCPITLAKAPIGLEWGSACSRLRLDEFGGRWCAVFSDRIEMETTKSALSVALEEGPASLRIKEADPRS